MSNESKCTPEGKVCSHPNWKKVAGAESPSGGMVVMCELCNATKALTPPVEETQKDRRPLLTEG